MTSAHIAPHIENFSKTVSQFNDHIESGHEAPHSGICDGINTTSLHLLQLAAQVKKSFPEPERRHFYVDLEKEGKIGVKSGQKFVKMKPIFLTQGVKCSDILLTLEGHQIAMIAMFDNLKAADPKYEEHCAEIEKCFMEMSQVAIATYSKP